MTLMRISRSGDTVLTPPRLPDYLSAVHVLKPITGKPKDEQVQAIHAVIRAMHSVAHLPTFYNPELSMELSQHLFSTQIAVYQADYSMCLLPGNKSVYTPPTLPSHISGTLTQIVGAPSDEEIRSVQDALRTADGMIFNPQLFDPDLSTKLSQHLFNLQFARYMHDSAQGGFAPDTETEEEPPVPQPTQQPQDSVGLQITNPEIEEQPGTQVSQNERVSEAPSASELAQLGDAMKAVGDTMSKSQDILDNMNRMLSFIKRDQCTIHTTDTDDACCFPKGSLNQHGEAASPHGTDTEEFRPLTQLLEPIKGRTSPPVPADLIVRQTRINRDYECCLCAGLIVGQGFAISAESSKHMTVEAWFNPRTSVKSTPGFSGLLGLRPGTNLKWIGTFGPNGGRDEFPTCHPYCAKSIGVSRF